MIDYALRMFCALVIAMFIWLMVGVALVAWFNRTVSIHYAGLLVLWVLVFLAMELAGFWRRDDG